MIKEGYWGEVKDSVSRARPEKGVGDQGQGRRMKVRRKDVSVLCGSLAKGDRVLEHRWHAKGERERVGEEEERVGKGPGGSWKSDGGP